MEFDLSRLKAERVAKGLEQSDVAELVGIDRSAYSRYETGARGMTVELLADIATALGIRAAQMGVFFRDE